MNQRIGINVSKELKNLKRRVKAPVISTGNTNNHYHRNSYFYDNDLGLDRDDYEEDCCLISNNIKDNSKTAFIVGASVVLGVAGICLLRRAMK